YVLRYTGKMFEPEQYRNIVLRANPDGSVLKLKEVADIEFGSLTYGMVSKENGRPSAAIMLKQRPGSNASEVIKGVKARMAELKATSFPPGMTYSVAYDVSRFLDASIHEVLKTLMEAFILVFIVVFVFLQDFRSTLIPALAVPVALIGTLFIMSLLGFSINLLTLFALVLAIGIVVDDAIVVVEAVHAKMHHEHLGPREATFAAMHEISGAIVAITLVMTAVFVPTSFLSGPVGVFYRQFSLTLASAILISAVNALTLTPALCSLLLKPVDESKKPGLMGRFFNWFNARYDNLADGYQKVLRTVAHRRVVTLGALLVFIGLAYGTSRILPAGFIPTEDQGMIYVNVTTPAGATVERTEEVLDQIQKIAAKLKPVESVSTLAGYSLLNDVAGSTYGMGMINLAAWEEREQSVDELIAELREKTKGIADAQIEFFPPPAVPGFGNASGVELRVLDKSGTGNLQRTADVTKDFLAALGKTPAVGSAFTNYDANFPQYLIHVDQEQAAKKGVTVDQAMSTLQTLIGSYYASNFIRFGQLYKVMVQAGPEYRANPEDLLKLYVKNNRGELVPY
ncbi:MAG: hydrophobe/amphiphile efflux-1 family RND transporter, partial [Hymenobacter sp.]